MLCADRLCRLSGRLNGEVTFAAQQFLLSDNMLARYAAIMCSSVRPSVTIKSVLVYKNG